MHQGYKVLLGEKVYLPKSSFKKPKEQTGLIKIWLRDHFTYANGKDSCLLNLYVGTAQGSVLGPILNSIFLSPLFDFTCTVLNIIILLGGIHRLRH
jgi:hypothetical protein